MDGSGRLFWIPSVTRETASLAGRVFLNINFLVQLDIFLIPDTYLSLKPVDLQITSPE